MALGALRRLRATDSAALIARHAWRLLATVLLCSAGLIGGPHAHATTVFLDDFDTPGMKPDTGRWTTEFGDPSFLGRTQLRDWVGGNGQFIIADGEAQLALNTFNPTGFSLYGTHAKTLMSFRPTDRKGFDLAVRLRLTSLQRGIVYGIYFFGCEGGPCATNHDELDIEIVTNFLQPGASPLRVQLNRYANEPFGAGSGPIVDLPPGFDPLASHEWRIRWFKNSVSYFVDGVELFSTTTFVPQGAMQANVIAWAPAVDWAAAFHSSLQPVASAALDQRFVALVDRVSVSEVAAPVAALCIPNATTLCIDDQPGDGRFQVWAAYQTTQGGGSAGNAQAIPLSGLGVTHGGLMWFFSADNPELLLKILPYGCATNGYYWVFASAGTNVGLVITITDLETGRQKVYTNPDVHPMIPIQDIMAFPCD